MTNFSLSENVLGGAPGSACGRSALGANLSEMRKTFRAVAPTGRAADSKSACCGFESLLPCNSVYEHDINEVADAATNDATNAATNDATNDATKSGYGN